MVQLSFLLEDESVSNILLPVQNPGCLGSGILALSLLNISTADDIVGLSSARSCTHKSPTCMHLKTSDMGHEVSIDASINSVILSSFHSFHACSNSNLNYYH